MSHHLSYPFFAVFSVRKYVDNQGLSTQSRRMGSSQPHQGRPWKPTSKYCRWLVRQCRFGRWVQTHSLVALSCECSFSVSWFENGTTAFLSLDVSIDLQRSNRHSVLRSIETFTDFHPLYSRENQQDLSCLSGNHSSIQRQNETAKGAVSSYCSLRSASSVFLCSPCRPAGCDLVLPRSINAGAAHGLAQEGINQGLSSDNTKQFNFEKTVSTLLYRSCPIKDVWYGLQIVFFHNLPQSEYMSMAL